MESDLSKINRAAQAWFSFAEKALLPSDAIALPHSCKGGFIQTTETGTGIDTIFIADSLARCGHDIDTAATGEAALELIPTGNCDLVLLDVMPPAGCRFEECGLIEVQGKGSMKTWRLTGRT